jgi:chromosome segregation ATPase
VAGLSMPVASLLVAAGMYWLSQQFEPISQAIQRIDDQVQEMRDVDDSQQRTLEVFRSALQDHESRLVNGKANRDRQAEQNAANFEKIDKKLETITDKIGDVNGALIGLKTTINERVPPRRNSLSEAQQ